MPRIALGIEYDGSAFTGWQSQPTGLGVQDALERALGAIAGIETRVAVQAAGRTDTGVHATAQIVHFDAPVTRPDDAWVRGVNAHLPSAASVLWMRHVSDDFHARFSATQRTYHYWLLNRPSRPALYARHVAWFHLPLDVAAMQAGAQYLIGTHDFSSFRSSQCQAKSPIRHLTRLDLASHGELIQFTITANAFLHHMVRNIVGALVYVGKGAQSPEWIAQLLAERDRTRAAPTFSPAGLYLVDIAYDARFGLPKSTLNEQNPTQNLWHHA